MIDLNMLCKKYILRIMLSTNFLCHGLAHGMDIPWNSLDGNLGDFYPSDFFHSSSDCDQINDASTHYPIFATEKKEEVIHDTVHYDNFKFDDEAFDPYEIDGLNHEDFEMFIDHIDSKAESEPVASDEPEAPVNIQRPQGKRKARTADMSENKQPRKRLKRNHPAESEELLNKIHGIEGIQGKHGDKEWETFATQLKGNQTYSALEGQCKRLKNKSNILKEDQEILRNLANAAQRLKRREGGSVEIVDKKLEVLNKIHGIEGIQGKHTDKEWETFATQLKGNQTYSALQAQFRKLQGKPNITLKDQEILCNLTKAANRLYIRDKNCSVGISGNQQEFLNEILRIKGIQGEHSDKEWENFATQLKGNKTYIALLGKCKGLKEKPNVSPKDQEILNNLSKAANRLYEQHELSSIKLNKTQQEFLNEILKIEGIQGKHSDKEWENFATQLKGNQSYAALLGKCKRLKEKSSLSGETQEILHNLTKAAERLYLRKKP